MCLHTAQSRRDIWPTQTNILKDCVKSTHTQAEQHHIQCILQLRKEIPPGNRQVSQRLCFKNKNKRIVLLNSFQKRIRVNYQTSTRKFSSIMIGGMS